MTLRSKRPIVVGVDGSTHALLAVEWAAHSAVRHGAPLHLVHAIGTGWDFGPRIGVLALHNQAYRDEGAAALAAAEQVARAAVKSHLVDITTEVEAPPPISVLTGRSRTAQLLVVGTRGMDRFERALLGSVSTALTNRAKCPLAVIPTRSAAEPSHLPVLVGVDGSACSLLAVEIAFDEASSRGVDVVAVLTWTEPDPGNPAAETAEQASALLSQSLAGYIEKHPDVHVRRVLLEGDPARRLLREAERAQLVVVGSRGRSGLTSLALGSVSSTVLHRAKIPIIIARPPA
ncbi:universal stress protein [Nocardia xishanensis]